MSPPELKQAPSYIVDGNMMNLGVFRGAIAHPNVPARGGPWRLKEWHHTSLLTETHFVALAVLQMGYVASLSCYVVELSSGRMWQSETLSPLGHHLRMSASSLHGRTSWRYGEDRVRIDHRESGFYLDLDCRVDGHRLRGHAHVSLGNSLALVQPLRQATALAAAQVAYTHKDAGMSAQLSLQWDGVDLPPSGLATLDWTRSVALRHTTWNWVSLAQRLADGRRLGLNLSAKVYVDEAGRQLENAMWVDGELRVLGNVSFEVPDKPTEQPWRIHGDELDLRFVPVDAWQSHVNLGVARSNFVQPVGHFSGWLQLPGGERAPVERAFGVVEDCDMLW